MSPIWIWMTLVGAAREPALRGDLFIAAIPPKYNNKRRSEMKGGITFFLYPLVTYN